MGEPAVTEQPRQGESIESERDGSGSRFHRLLDKLPTGAYTCDADGLITYYNPHAVKVWGRAPRLNDPVDRFCGSFRLHLPDGSPLAHDQCWMALAIKTQREYNGHEIVIERPDGSRITALAHANPIHDESGRLLGAVNVLVDIISERKRAEEALAEADRRKDGFLTALSHELRGPLTPIRMAADVVRKNAPASSGLQWAAGLIDRQVQHLGRLVGDLLDLARIARGTA